MIVKTFPTEKDRELRASRNQTLRAALRASQVDFERRVFAARPHSFLAGMTAGLGLSICFPAFPPVVELFFAVLMNHLLTDQSERRDGFSRPARGRRDSAEIRRLQWTVAQTGKGSAAMPS